MFTKRQAKKQVRIEPATDKLVRHHATKEGRSIQVEVNRALNIHYTGNAILARTK